MMELPGSGADAAAASSARLPSRWHALPPLPLLLLASVSLQCSGTAVVQEETIVRGINKASSEEGNVVLARQPPLLDPANPTSAAAGMPLLAAQSELPPHVAQLLLAAARGVPAVGCPALGRTLPLRNSRFSGCWRTLALQVC